MQLETKKKNEENKVESPRKVSKDMLVDLDTSQEVITEVAQNVKNHFSDAFYEAMERLQNYGDIIEVSKISKKNISIEKFQFSIKKKNFYRNFQKISLVKKKFYFAIF